MTDTKADKVRQSITVEVDLQRDVMIRFLETGGSTGEGFNGAANAAFLAYTGPPKASPADVAGVAGRIMDWLSSCHNNQVDYLAAEFACRRAFGIRPEEWEDFQKGLRK